MQTSGACFSNNHQSSQTQLLLFIHGVISEELSGRMAGEDGASFTLSQEELYRLGLSFYKEQEAKGLQVVEEPYS